MSFKNTLNFINYFFSVINFQLKKIYLTSSIYNRKISKIDDKTLDYKPSQNLIFCIINYPSRREKIETFNLESVWLNEELKFHQFYLEILKGNRIQGHTSDPYRICVPACERIKTRRPKGFIVFPMYERDESNPEDNQTLETCNYLLQHAVKVAGIKKRKGMTFTNIRHTAFFLMVSENREMFITDSEIETFAKNGHTSLDQFRDTYINKIDAKNLGKKVRKKTKDQVTKYELLKPDALVKNREAFVDLILSKMPERRSHKTERVITELTLWDKILLP